MRQTYRVLDRHYVGAIRRVALTLVLLLLISMIGCNRPFGLAQDRRYVVINGDETVQVKKGELDRIYQDNENLLKALEKCRTR